MTIRENAYLDARILFLKYVTFIFILQKFYVLTKERRRKRKKTVRQMEQRKPILQSATDMVYTLSDFLIFFDVTIYLKIVLCCRAILELTFFQ